MRKVLLVKNIPREGPGIVAEQLAKRKIAFDTIEMAEGTRLPDPSGYSAIFVFGGPDSANDNTGKMGAELSFVRSCVESGVPYFGVCLGMQVLCRAMGGNVVPNQVREIGFRGLGGGQFSINPTREGKSDLLFAGLPGKIGVFHLHGETGTLAPGMKLLATGEDCRNQVVKAGGNAYGFQGHLELTEEMFKAWLNEDSWLRASDRAALEKDFEKFGGSLRESGNRIIGNFLSIAGL